MMPSATSAHLLLNVGFTAYPLSHVKHHELTLPFTVAVCLSVSPVRSLVTYLMWISNPNPALLAVYSRGAVIKRADLLLEDLGPSHLDSRRASIYFFSFF